MTSEELAITIRKQDKQKNKLTEKIHQIFSKCKHEKVVILCSYYDGSYSYDRDDWHPEIRKCLICNLIECGPSIKPIESDFKTLKNPVKRFECQLFSTNEEWENCPLFNTLNFSLKELELWVSKNGYTL